MTSEKESKKVPPQKEKNKSFRGIAAFSLLISLFDRLGDWVYGAFLEEFAPRIQH